MTAIATLLGTILSAVWFLWKRHIEQNATPEEKSADRHEQVSKEIIRDDESGANRRVDDWLREIQSRKSGPGNSPAESDSTIPPAS